MLRAAPVILMASIVAACSTVPDASSSPAVQASGADLSAGASPQTARPQSAIPGPTAAQTTVTPRTTPPAAAFDWGEAVAMTGSDGFSMYRPLFEFARGVYVVAELSRIWVSSDARRWDVADSPVDGNEHIEIRDLVADGSGFVAVGNESIDADEDGSPEDSRAVVLMSSDGRRWQRLEDRRFEHAAMNFVARSRAGVVAFGYTLGGVGASIWTSANGTAWIKATNETGLQVAEGVQVIAETDGKLTAFVALPGPTLDESGPVEVWQTEGRADWEKVGALPEQSDVYVHYAAHGGGRWVAFGVAPASQRAWTSTDGRNWTQATSPGGGGISAIVGWAGGLIATTSTGSEPGETCGGSEPWVGRSWLSIGATWQALPPTDGAAIRGLVIVDDRVVGIGHAIRADGGVDPVHWTATLPTTSVQPAPEPTSTPTPTPKIADGCGN